MVVSIRMCLEVLNTYLWSWANSPVLSELVSGCDMTVHPTRPNEIAQSLSAGGPRAWWWRTEGKAREVCFPAPPCPQKPNKLQKRWVPRASPRDGVQQELDIIVHYFSSITAATIETAPSLSVLGTLRFQAPHCMSEIKDSTKLYIYCDFSYICIQQIKFNLWVRQRKRSTILTVMPQQSDTQDIYYLYKKPGYTGQRWFTLWQGRDEW